MQNVLFTFDTSSALICTAFKKSDNIFSERGPCGQPQHLQLKSLQNLP